MTETVLSWARTDYDVACTAGSDQIEYGLDNCKHYNMEVSSRQNFQPERFVKNFISNFLPRTHFHMVISTAVDKRLTLQFKSTALTVPMINKARTEDYGGGRVDAYETKNKLFTVSSNISKPS